MPLFDLIRAYINGTVIIIGFQLVTTIFAKILNILADKKIPY